MVDPATGGAIGVGIGIGKELAKAALAPAAKEMGEPLRLIVARAMGPLTRRLKRPEQVTDEFLEKVLGRLADRGITPDAVRQPAEEIVAQVVFANLISGVQPDIQEMFANLLASELDCSRPRTRPAFVEVVRQLSGAEARVLKELAKRGYSDPLHPKVTIKHKRPGTPEPPENHIPFGDPFIPGADLLPLVEGGSAEAFTSIVENLIRLRITTVTNHPPGIDPSPRVLALTWFGRELCDACIDSP